MNFAPLLAAAPIVKWHTLAALLALLIGVAVVVTRKGSTVHVWLGRIWVNLMLLVALSSFWIKGFGHVSWIHFLSIVTLVSIPVAIHAKRVGNIRRHAITMSMTFLGLMIAGAFTLIPGRILGAAVFGW